MSVERCFSVVYPIKAKTTVSIKTAKWSGGITVIILMFFQAQWFYLIEPVTQDGETECEMINNSAKKYFEEIYSQIDSALYSFIPITIILPCNVAIIIKMNTSKKVIGVAGEGNKALSKAAGWTNVSCTKLLLSVCGRRYSVLVVSVCL